MEEFRIIFGDIKENWYQILIIVVIFTVVMWVLINWVLKSNLSSSDSISDQLIESLPKRLLTYGLLLFFSTVLEMFKDHDVLKSFFTILLYALVAYFIKKSLMTKGNQPYITDKHSSVVITLELAQIMLIAVFDNNYLFMVCLLCLWGKWFWLDKTFNESMQLMKDSIIDTVIKEKSTQKYGLMYIMVLVTTLAWKMSCLVLSHIMQNWNYEIIYLVSGALLIVSTGFNICFIPKRKTN